MLPTGLSMLWEATDADAALHDRFGFSDVGAAAAWCSAALGEVWDLEVLDCSRTVISDRNAILWLATDRGPRIVKWSVAAERFDRLAATARLLRTLADEGLPVARPTPSRAGEDRVVLAGPSAPLSVVVLPELPGEWLDVRDEAAVRSAGSWLARLHRGLRGAAIDPALLPDRDEDLRGRIAAWLTTTPTRPGVERIGRLVARAPDLDVAPQLVHHDYRAANVLTRGSAVTAILDLDETRVAPRVHDLAQASVLLGTRFTGWQPTTPTVRAAFRSGYEAVDPLTRAERAWLEILTSWIAQQVFPAADTASGQAPAH